ncbi:hypothetical protein C5S39_00795 [Candidatus Methanophagaceae archaeon]|nr:hypothetical protein C5S39_00795 [Methanophagales archaeon]
MCKAVSHISSQINQKLVVPFSVVAGINMKGRDKIDTRFKFHYGIM